MNLWLQDAYSFKITKRLNNNCEKLCRNGFIGQCVVPQSKGSSIDISRIDRMDNLQRTNLERDEITKCQSWTKIFFSALKMNISFVYFAYLIEWRQKVDRIFPPSLKFVESIFFCIFSFPKNVFGESIAFAFVSYACWFDIHFRLICLIAQIKFSNWITSYTTKLMENMSMKCQTTFNNYKIEHLARKLFGLNCWIDF